MTWITDVVIVLGAVALLFVWLDRRDKVDLLDAIQLLGDDIYNELDGLRREWQTDVGSVQDDLNRIEARIDDLEQLIPQ